jgi:hypothetical protein
MTLAMNHRPHLLPLGRAGRGASDAVKGVGALAACAPIRPESAVRGPGPRLRPATEPPLLTHAPIDVARFSAAPLATPPPLRIRPDQHQHA